MTHTPGWSWWDLRELWLEYPHRDLMLITKLYYTLQLAFWTSQVVVTLVEKVCALRVVASWLRVNV